MTCQTCVLLKNKEQILYEDREIVVVVMSPTIRDGAVALIPKKHYATIEEIPPTLFGTLLSAAKVMSAAVFSALEAQGTNVMVHAPDLMQPQTHPHVLVVPRSADDGLTMRWELKRAEERELDEILQKLSEETFFIGKEKNKSTDSVTISTPLPPKNSTADLIIGPRDPRENYLLRQLERIP